MRWPLINDHYHDHDHDHDHGRAGGGSAIEEDPFEYVYGLEEPFEKSQTNETNIKVNFMHLLMPLTVAVSLVRGI